MRVVASDDYDAVFRIYRNPQLRISCTAGQFYAKDHACGVTTNTQVDKANDRLHLCSVCRNLRTKKPTSHGISAGDCCQSVRDKTECRLCTRRRCMGTRDISTVFPSGDSCLPDCPLVETTKPFSPIDSPKNSPSHIFVRSHHAGSQN